MLILASSWFAVSCCWRCLVFFGGEGGSLFSSCVFYEGLRATLLGPKPSLFVLFSFLVLFFILFLRVGWGEVLLGATSLGPKPSLFVCPFCFLFLYFSFFAKDTEILFSPKNRTFLLVAQCLPCFLVVLLVAVFLTSFVYFCLFFFFFLSWLLVFSLFWPCCLPFFVFWAFFLGFCFFLFICWHNANITWNKITWQK